MAPRRRISRSATSIADTARADTRSLIRGDSIYTCAHVRQPDSTSTHESRTVQAAVEEKHAWGAYELPELLKARDRERRMETERMGRKRRRHRPKSGAGDESDGTLDSDVEEGGSRGESNSRSVAGSHSEDETETARRRPGPRPRRKRASRAASSGVSETGHVDVTDESEGEEDKQERRVFYTAPDVDEPNLPDAGLLGAILRHASQLYTDRGELEASEVERPGGKKRAGYVAPVTMKRSLNGSALMALGVLLEEHAKASLSDT